MKRLKSFWTIVTVSFVGFCCSALNSWDPQRLSHREDERCESLRVLEDVVRANNTEMIRYLIW